MANNGDLRSVASMLLGLNFCMYLIVVAIASWATNNAINEGFFIAPGLSLPPQFSPICYSMGNAATGFLAVFSMIAGFVWKEIELQSRNAKLPTLGIQYCFETRNEDGLLKGKIEETFRFSVNREAYTVYAEAITGDQYIFNLQSTYSSDENLQSAYSSDETVAVDTFVDESMVASESADPKTFANLFEEFVDKLNDMAGLLPVSKNGKAKVKEGDDVNAKVKERTTLLIKSGSDAKGSGTGEKVGAFRNIDEEESDEDLVGIAEQLLNMRYLSLHQNNKYLQL
nr:membrane protein PM19L-like [Ipomoea batatas]